MIANKNHTIRIGDNNNHMYRGIVNNSNNITLQDTHLNHHPKTNRIINHTNAHRAIDLSFLFIVVGIRYKIYI